MDWPYSEVSNIISYVDRGLVYFYLTAKLTVQLNKIKLKTLWLLKNFSLTNITKLLVVEVVGGWPYDFNPIWDGG